MCGIIGITGIDDVVQELYAGMIALQHRGQDACGIHTFSDKINVKKGRGLVQEVFNQDNITTLRGDSGIGHVRYSTVGTGTDEDDIQPFYESLFFISSMAHNGNLTNFSELKDMYGNIASGCDLEAILKVFHTHAVGSAMSLEREGSFPVKIDICSDVSIDMVFDSIKKVMETSQGSYSVIANLPGLGMMGFKDPYGIKPLAVARKSVPRGTAFCFASEDVAFQIPLGYDFIKEIGPGSVFLATTDGRVIEKSIVDKKVGPKPCIFELIYFASQTSILDSVSVSEFRYQLGKELGTSFMDDDAFDREGVICAPVPSASERGAAGFSDATGIPLRDVFVRNAYLRRGFILPDKSAREYNAALKLPIDFSVLRDARYVILIDDSIVRGDTSRIIIERLRTECSKRALPLEKVGFGVLAPPNAFPCVYGIDMPVDKELIYAKSGDLESVRKYIGVDHLMYNRIEVLDWVLSRLKGEGSGMCNACFSGVYPTGISHQEIDRLKQERLADKGSDY
ncbi:MAG: amidophosphoribosyltransferase [Candidatus Woesearchaeota archaeon]